MIPDLEQAQNEWMVLADRLERLSDLLREMPRFKGIMPDSQMMVDAVATVMVQTVSLIRSDVVRNGVLNT